MGCVLRVGATLAVVPVMQRITSPGQQPSAARDDPKGRPYALILSFVVVDQLVIIVMKEQPPWGSASSTTSPRSGSSERCPKNAMHFSWDVEDAVPYNS